MTRKSFRYPYTIEELRLFYGKKNLVLVYFDLGPDDCLVRDIIEKRGDLWEKYGGELWGLYGGLEEEWEDSVDPLSHADEWKLEAQDGKWIYCILRAITLLAFRLGRRSIVDRLTKWREKVEKESSLFFEMRISSVGKRSCPSLNFYFSETSVEIPRETISKLKARPMKRNLTIGRARTNSMDENKSDRLSESSKMKENNQLCGRNPKKRLNYITQSFLNPSTDKYQRAMGSMA